MIYPPDMDTECIPLCNAINAIPGMKTNQSYCGHGKEPLRIWFHAKSLHNLYVIARHVDRRYGGHPDWLCIVDDSDVPERCVIFRVDSMTEIGEPAYKTANKIAEIFWGF